VKLILGIMAGAFALAGWRNMPRLDQPSASAAGLVIGICLVLAYNLGARSTRASAMAVATARAEAHATALAQGGSARSTVNVVIADGGRRAARAEHAALDDLPWIDYSAQPVASELPQDVIESMTEDVRDVEPA
jgi:hypothetical protein